MKLWNRRKRIAALEGEVERRDEALRRIRYIASHVEIKAASFGLHCILDSRYSEIELSALNVRQIAERIVGPSPENEYVAFEEFGVPLHPRKYLRADS